MFNTTYKKRLTPYCLIAPVLIFIIIVYGYPLLLTFKYSFQNVSLIGNDSTFVGFENFKNVLTNPKLYSTIILTFKWTLLTVFLKISISFIIALFLNGKIYIRKLNRFLVLIPWAIPQVVAAILWSWILDGQYGYLNYFLEQIGAISGPLSWLSDTSLAFISTAIVDAWMGIPLVTMMFLSALSNIPEPLYEAAKIDGANIFKRFIHITLPSIKTVFFIILNLTTIWTFNSFNVIYVLTKGGPMRATETIIIKIYEESIGKYNLGISSTLSVIVFVILTTLSLIYFKQINKGEK